MAFPEERHIRSRIASAWPDAQLRDCFILYPLGGRLDALIFNRTNGEVTTGTRIGTGYCYRGTLEEFAEAVEKDYGARIEVPPGTQTERWIRCREEYRAAIVFLRTLVYASAPEPRPER